MLGVVEAMDVFEHVAANPDRGFAADACDDELEPFVERGPAGPAQRRRRRRTR